MGTLTAVRIEKHPRFRYPRPASLWFLWSRKEFLRQIPGYDSMGSQVGGPSFSRLRLPQLGHITRKFDHPLDKVHREVAAVEDKTLGRLIDPLEKVLATPPTGQEPARVFLPPAHLLKQAPPQIAGAVRGNPPMKQDWRNITPRTLTLNNILKGF